MYIEVFLLDNFIFDMLIIATASALSRAPFSHIAATVVCIVLSVTAAFAQRLPFLRSLPVKLIMCGIAAVPFYVKYKKITIKPCIYIFAATFIIGGMVYALTNGTFSFASGYVRLFIYPAFVALFIPKIIRKIQLNSIASLKIASDVKTSLINKNPSNLLKKEQLLPAISWYKSSLGPRYLPSRITLL